MDKTAKNIRRKKSIRKKIFGTSDRPRMSVFKSNKNISVQIIDDVEGKTLCSASTTKMGSKNATCSNIDFAKKVGEDIAKRAVDGGIKRVVFDRSGYRYHGVIKALADAARENGLDF